MIEYLLVKVRLIITLNGWTWGNVIYYTVIKKESISDNTTFCYYILYNKGHIFKKRLSKNLVSRLLMSGRFSFFDHYDTDSDFIKSLLSMVVRENTTEDTSVTDCTVVLIYNLI